MNHAEFERVARQYADMLYKIAYNYLKNREDSEDAVQNTLIRLFRQQDFKSEEHLRAWLIRVTINESKRILSGNKKRIAVRSEQEAQAFYHDDADSRELFLELMRLKPEYSTALYLRYYEGYSADEIAAMLGKSGTAVRALLSRARKKLKTQLEEE